MIRTSGLSLILQSIETICLMPLVRKRDTAGKYILALGKSHDEYLLQIFDICKKLEFI